MAGKADKSRLTKQIESPLGQRRTSKHLTRTASLKLRHLARLLREHDARCWKIGDLVHELLTRHRCSLGLLARHTNYSRSRLSELHLTAAAFSPDQREGYTFQDCLLARQIRKRLRGLRMSLLDVRAEIRRFRLKKLREARAHFVRKLLAEQARHAYVASAKMANQGAGLINRCHHADFRAVVPKLPDESVKLFLADPPFGAYSHLADGGYLSGRAATNGLRIDCDANTTDEALGVTLPLFDLCLPKLAPGGCLLLFQPGSKPDRPEILHAASVSGWTCRHALTWLKTQRHHSTPCNCVEPYAVSTERILVLARAGDQLQWHEQGLSRSDVLAFQSETQKAATQIDRPGTRFEQIHMFQKPLALTEFLVRKHTFPGDLVVEPFGCSGSGVIPAARLGRRWVYIESNEVNFAWGSRRVMEATAQLSTAAG